MKKSGRLCKFISMLMTVLLMLTVISVGAVAANPHDVTYYRYRTKSFTTSTKSTLSGWTATGNSTSNTSYGSWGSWSEWFEGTLSETDTRDVKTATVYGYCYFECANCGAHMHVKTGCYTWAGGCGRTTTDGQWHQMWSDMTWDEAGFKDWYGTGHYYCYINGERWFKWINSDGTPRAGYSYRTRSKTVTTTYEFYKWSDWSSWSTTPVTASSTVDVETEVRTSEHNYVAQETVAAKCTTKGYTKYVCSICSDSYYTYTNALGHNTVNHTAKPATCTEKGWNAYQTCTRCSYSTYAEIAAKGHTLVNHAAKPATCTEKGWNAYNTCKNCNYTTYKEISAKGHTLVNHEAKPATCIEKGWDAYQTCANCSYSTYSEIAPVDHQAGGWIIDENPTCSTKGIRHKECTVCHEVLEYGEMDMLDHHDSDGDGKCDDCGSSISSKCSHLCHKSGFLGFIWKIINLFNKLFKINQYCSCGARHW